MTGGAWFALAFAGGLAALYLGAEALIRGAVVLARELRMSPFTVGVTVVAFGGSVPELAVGVLAAAEGHGALAMGNIIGSNVANLGLILGLGATLRTIPVDMRIVRHQIPFMVSASLGLGILSLDEHIGRLEGVVFLLAFGTFVWRMLNLAQEAPAAVEGAYVEQVAAVTPELGPAPARRRRAVALAAVGIGALVLGAQLLVLAAAYYAGRVGVSEAVVGLTVVALGTSLPELATTMVAVIHRNSDIALGNVVGSNVFNIFAIVGAAALIEPLALDPSSVQVEVPFLIVLSAVFLPLASRRARLGRREGSLLVLSYALFLWVVGLRVAG